VINVARFGQILVAPSTLSINSIAELLAQDKQKSSLLNVASSGNGTSNHLVLEKFKAASGTVMTHIPFKGGPEALTEVVTGRVDFMSIGIASGLPFIRDGRLLALGVSTVKRSTALPDVPTTLEGGYVDSDYTFWNGMLAPAKTPRPIIDRLHQEVQKVLALPAVRDRFALQGIEPMPLSPVEIDALIRKEIVSNIAIAKAAKLKFD